MTNNIILIGMAGAGKSTIGREMALLLRWEFIDTDKLLEENRGACLEDISRQLSRDEFLDLEAALISKLDVRHTVIATGGSAIYRSAAIEHLRQLGTIIFITVPMPLIAQRIASQPGRGLVRAPGQNLQQLYEERQQLYLQAADICLPGGEQPAQVYAQQALVLLGCQPPVPS